MASINWTIGPRIVRKPSRNSHLSARRDDSESSTLFPGFWQAILAGASAAIVHHTVLYMLSCYRHNPPSDAGKGSQRDENNKNPSPIDLKKMTTCANQYAASTLDICESIMSRIERYFGNRMHAIDWDSLMQSARSVLSTEKPLFALGGYLTALLLLQDRQGVKASSYWTVSLALTPVNLVLLTSTLWLTARSMVSKETRRAINDRLLLSDILEVCKKSPSTKEPTASSSKPDRCLELMVHNVSHTDVLFSFQTDAMAKDANTECDANYALCRPRFSCFDSYCRKALEASSRSADNLDIIKGPLYQRSLENSRLRIQDEPATGLPKTPIGFRFPAPIAVDDWKELRVRGSDQSMVSGAESNGRLRQVFFPLLASLLPRWRGRIAGKRYSRTTSVNRVLILVTGVGTPRNWTHSEDGNSTAVAADLMTLFLKRIDPSLTVVHIHSNTNIFRYDQNLLFVEGELLPVIESFRDAHARGLPYPGANDISRCLNCSWTAPHRHNAKNPFNVDLLSTFSITLSFADGSQARTHAIQASLRPFRPTYFHFWQLKTFWHESKIVDDDIEVHTFESMDTVPPMDVANFVDPWITSVVKEMKAYLEEFVNCDRDNFWLRKTQKAVLSILLVQTSDMKEPVLYRGANMEVSMPTGSLCAERNAIGSALSEHPTLRREDVKLVAVLAVPEMESSPDRSGLPSTAMHRVPSTSTIASTEVMESLNRKISIGSEFDDSKPSIHKASIGSYEEVGDTDTGWVPVPDDGMPTASEQEEEDNSTPVRRIPLFSSSQKSRRTLVVNSYKDGNPLKPCGACNEWLKKIADTNPYFRVITFTDANCNGIYVERCLG